MSDAPPVPGRRDRRDSWTAVLVGLFIAAWIALLLRNLGDLSLWMDEGFHYLAAQGILEHGYPLYPSGHIYWKAILYAYALAAGALAFGLEASTLRILSVLCVAATIGLAYHVGRRYFSRSVGLLAAALLAFSAWELEYARLALYFAPLGLFYLLSLYVFYRGFFEEERRFKAPAIALFLLTPLIHQLGMGVVFAFPALLLVKGGRRFFRKDVLAGLGITAAFYLGIQIQEYFFWKVGYVYEKTDMSLQGMIAYFFGSFNLDYFKEFFRAFPWMSLAVLAGLFLCLGGLGRRPEGGPDPAGPGRAREPWLYLNLCLLFPLFFLAFFRTHVQPRYLAQLFPVFVLLFLAALQAFSRVAVRALAAPALGIRTRRPTSALTALVFLGLFLALAEGASPRNLLSIVGRRYGDPITTDIITRSGRFEHYDHAGVGDYIRRRLGPDDVVVAIHVVFQKIYIGRVDYWLWSGGPGTWDAWEKTPDGWKDFYVGARWVNSLEDLRKIVEENPGRRVWLASSPSLYRLDHINREIHEFIAVLNADKLAFRGKDGLSEVFVWNDPRLIEGGRRALEGEWLPARRGTVVAGPGLSGGEAMEWTAGGKTAEGFTAEIAGVRAAGGYTITIRYRAPAPRPGGDSAAAAVVLDENGTRLRALVLDGASRPEGPDGWREARASFVLARPGGLRLRLRVPATMDLAIDYADIATQEASR